jgi:GMP synthase-like glutamine amidotransferase
MRVLVFRHVPFEGLGLIEPALTASGIGFEYAGLYAPGAPAPDPAAADGLIFMGGPMSVNGDLAYLRQEERYIAQAVACGKPVLGVCLGAQLIAHALGASVYRNPVKEIGWFPVTWGEAAATDPLFAGLPPVDTVFHWHGETFDLPPGAVPLASSAACRNQAFRAGRNVYGLQFHLEVTPAMVADWSAQDANSGDVRELDRPPDPHYNAARLVELSSIVFGRWTRLVWENATSGPGAGTISSS